MAMPNQEKDITSIMSLPDELLVMVLKDLPISELKNMALVSSRFRPIAEQCIYTVVESYNPWMFLHALSIRPHLGAHVRSLKLDLCAVWKYNVPISEPSEEISTSLSPNPLVRKSVSLANVLGAILDLTPNLKSLIIHNLINDTVVDPYGPKHWSMPFDLLVQMFGEAALQETFDFSTIPGLRSTSSLIIRGQIIPWAICSMPNLRNIDVNLWYNTDLMSSTRNNDSPATSIKIHTKTAILKPGHMLQKTLTPWLQNFPKLNKLVVDVTDNSHSYSHGESARGFFKFESFLHALAPVSGTLQSLSILTDVIGCDLLDHASPLRSMEGFDALTSLVVPQEALFNPDGETWSDSAKTMVISETFPASLERLCILNPRRSVFIWLEMLLVAMNYYPQLRAIDLQCSPDRGLNYTELKWWWPLFWVTRALNRRGLDVQLSNSTKTSEVGEYYDQCGMIRLSDFFDHLTDDSDAYRSLPVIFPKIPYSRIPHTSDKYGRWIAFCRGNENVKATAMF